MSKSTSRNYRAKILFALDKNLEEELAWLNKISLNFLKNYQIWLVYIHCFTASSNNVCMGNQAPPTNPRLPLPKSTTK